MKPTQRIMPLTNKQLWQKAAITVSLLVGCLVTTLGIFQVEYLADLWWFLVGLGVLFGVYGLALLFKLFIQQIPKSRTFYESSNLTQAVILGRETEKSENQHIPASPGTPDVAGCLGIILDFVLMAIPRDPTYRYYLDIQFKVAETGQTQDVRAKVKRYVFYRIKKGDDVEVQYATADPRVLLIDLEIPNKSVR